MPVGASADIRIDIGDEEGFFPGGGRRNSGGGRSDLRECR